MDAHTVDSRRTSPGEAPVVITARDVEVRFPVQGARGRFVSAVDDVDLDIRAGETLGLVGESGCGKSTLGRALIGLRPLHGGLVEMNGEAVSGVPERILRPRRRHMQVVFQDPYGSLNPRMRIGDTIAEPITTFGLRRGKAVQERVSELLQQVGLEPDMAHRFPHEFSGGQRQRIAIARALAAEPEFIVCDEPISALDVSTQAQILNLLIGLREELSLTYLFISHDLAVVRRVCNRIAVMYLGRIVEIADRDDLYSAPRHPYTAALLSAVPFPDPAKERTRERIELAGDIPTPENPPPGCSFHTRCWIYEQLGKPEKCRTAKPQLGDSQGSHEVACHFPLAAPAAANQTEGAS